MTLQRIAFPLVVLSLLGAGCFGIGPRIARAPADAGVSDQAAQLPGTSTDTSATSGLAYVELNGGTATMTRGAQTVDAQDGLELLQGDEVDVTSGSVDLIYPDAGKSQLSAGTKIVIIPDDGNGEMGGVFTQVQLLGGSIWTRFEKVFGPEEHFSVASNGVVATVRGTGFGVTMDGDGVDVQVAEHEVQVATEEQLQDGASGAPSTNVVAVDAGQGLHVSPKDLAGVDANSVKTLIRRLSMGELARREFVFASTKLFAGSFKRPARIIRLPIAPALKTEIQQRIQLLQRRAMLDRVFPTFVHPLRVPLEADLHVATTTPSASGPSAQPLP